MLPDEKLAKHIERFDAALYSEAHCRRLEYSMAEVRWRGRYRSCNCFAGHACVATSKRLSSQPRAILTYWLLLWHSVQMTLSKKNAAA